MMALKTAADVKSWLVDNGFEEYATKFYGKRSQTISYNSCCCCSIHTESNAVLLNHESSIMCLQQSNAPAFNLFLFLSMLIFLCVLLLFLIVLAKVILLEF